MLFHIVPYCSILLHIASLFNLSLSTGVVPTSYKDTYVIPRLKKPTLPCGDLSSYRPISNLPFLSKLLKRVVSVQLTDYVIGRTSSRASIGLSQVPFDRDCASQGRH